MRIKILVVVAIVAAVIFILLQNQSSERIEGMPSGFPKDVYIYDGARVTEVMMERGKIVGASGRNPMLAPGLPRGTFMIELTTPDSPASVLNMYKQNMEGWEVVDAEDANDKMAAGIMRMLEGDTVIFRKKDRLVTVMTGASETGTTTITLQHIGP